MVGLYLHIPFCSAICTYCNFNRGLFDRALKDAYLDALEQEIRQGAGAITADTIYFGGGTPSLLTASEISRLVGTCADAVNLAPGTEITLETNPETVDEAILAGFRDAGINRLSLGVQSFHDDELRQLGRIHDAARARQTVAAARAAGFDNISLDLMMWLPGQTVARWRENVEALIALDPEHASLYLLELYPNAPLKEDMARAGLSQAPDDDAADMYEWAMERLECAGYRQYEISNFARPGHECRHNLLYWSQGDYRGFGCAAHSHAAGRRWWNLRTPERYIAAVHAGASTEAADELLDDETRALEALQLAVRTRGGVPLAALDPEELPGLVERHDDRWVLTVEGRLLANEVSVRLRTT